MKKKLVVVIAAILMLALTVSTVSAEDSLNSTIDSVSVNEGNNLMTSDTTSLHQEAVNTNEYKSSTVSGKTQITAKIPAALLNDIDKEVDSLTYVDNWGISKDQFKIMLAVLAWGEGNPDGKCRYAAHSSDTADKWHKDLPNNFHFSSGLGPFQITATDKWTTIDKLNSKKALDDTIIRHKTYSKGSFENIEDVRSKLKNQWFAYRLSSEGGGEFEEKWKEATGTNWNDVKYTNKETANSPLDWKVIKKELKDESEVESKAVEDIGMRKWTISKGDGVKNYNGDTIELNKDLSTWLIHAKKLPEGNKAKSYEYYYTYDDAQKIEIWAYSNPSDTQHDKKSIFIRTYTKPGDWDLQRRPDNDGLTLSHPVFTDSAAHVMLVIDRSGSMYGTPISNAKNAASLFVDYMEPDDMAGVVSFSTSARYDHHLTTLTNDNKSSIKDKIGKISASGNTAIGSGLRYGLNDLLAYGDSSTPQAIVLLSDGLQNSGEHPNKVIPDITDNKIKVYTVGLGSNADEGLLGDIATKTGGKYYYSPTENQLQNIYNDIVGEVTGLTPIKDLTFNMVKGDHTFIAYKTDSTMKKAIASVFWPGSNVDLVLHKPDGSIVDPSEAESDPDIEYIASSTYKIYKVSNPELGEWTMELTATDMPTGGEDVSVTVRAESTLSMSLSTDKDQYIQGESVKITSGISNGETKITTADVKSNITLPDSSINHLTLYDDGSHGDGGAKDGIYANFFDNTSLKGDYTVDATATGSLSDGSQFNRIEDSSFKIIQGTNSILLLPDNLSIEGKTGEKITKNITVSTSQALTSVAITPTSLQSENGDIIDTSNIKVNPAAVNVSSGVPETILVTINIPESATSGNYTGKINAIGTNGSDSCTIHLHVTDDNVTDTVPVANFTSSATSGKAPLKVKFTDTSTGSPTSWFWNFGDGSKSFHQNPSHKYSKAGIYTVNLTVKNDIGRNTVTKTEYINVITKPVANFTSSATSGKAPLKVKFTDTSTGTPAAWKWDFGDGSKSFHQNPTHKYSNAGVYNVSLKVKNAAGSNTVTKTNYIKVITKPVASFTSNVTSGKAPLKVTFTDTSTGIPAKWKWSFGDGTISREQNPEHQYLQGGSYKVTLTVSNAAGGNTITKTNYIKVTTNTRPGIYSENK